MGFLYFPELRNITETPARTIVGLILLKSFPASFIPTMEPETCLYWFLLLILTESSKMRKTLVLGHGVPSQTESKPRQTSKEEEFRVFLELESVYRLQEHLELCYL